MSKTSYHILVNIDDLYRKLLQAYDKQFTDYSKRNYEWFLKKGRNLNLKSIKSPLVINVFLLKRSKIVLTSLQQIFSPCPPTG